MSKHTKGPWRIYQNPRTETVHIIGYKSDHICVLGPYPYDDEGKANASLIAAAPEMLKTLKNVLKTHQRPFWEETTLSLHVLKEAWDVIDKAEGKDDD